MSLPATVATQAASLSPLALSSSIPQARLLPAASCSFWPPTWLIDICISWKTNTIWHLHLCIHPLSSFLRTFTPQPLSLSDRGTTKDFDFIHFKTSINPIRTICPNHENPKMFKQKPLASIILCVWDLCQGRHFSFRSPLLHHRQHQQRFQWTQLTTRHTTFPPAMALF